MVGSTRIMNVNDRAISRYLAEEMLRRGGYDVVSLSSGCEALACLEQGFDLVLLDVQLLGIDGFEVCRQIKAHRTSKTVAVLMTSAKFVTPANRVMGLESGADGYLVQPFEQAELLATIRSILRGRDVERTAAALRRDVESRDRFLAMLGHELRNPLASITTALELLNTGDDPVARMKYLPLVVRNSKHLARIVDDLLEVSRVTHDKIVLKKEIVDLHAVAMKCAESVALGSGRARGVTIDVTGSAVQVRGDKVRIYQIATNLIDNAVKYGRLDGRIVVGLSILAGMGVMEVRDDGVGMDPETLANVFDAFVQGHQGLERRNGGLGLGLTVVRKLVELHGGSITASSQGEGQGSVFTVRLPLAVDEHDEVSDGSVAPASSSSQTMSTIDRRS